jgi:hypothetical protein
MERTMPKINLELIMKILREIQAEQITMSQQIGLHTRFDILTERLVRFEAIIDSRFDQIDTKLELLLKRVKEMERH